MEDAPARADAHIAPPELRVGDAWLFVTHAGDDAASALRVRSRIAAVDADGGFALEVNHGDKPEGPWRRQWFDAWFGMRAREVDAGEGKSERVTYAPAFAILDFPLFPGKRWRRDVVQAQPDWWMETPMTLEFEALGVERVEVPAGPFDAMHLRGRVTTPDAEVAVEAWYAPEAGRIIKGIERARAVGEPPATGEGSRLEYVLHALDRRRDAGGLRQYGS